MHFVSVLFSLLNFTLQINAGSSMYDTSGGYSRRLGELVEVIVKRSSFQLHFTVYSRYVVATIYIQSIYFRTSVQCST